MINISKNYKSQKIKEERNKKIQKIMKNFSMFVILVFIGLYSLYLYLHYTEGFTLYISPYDIQKEYARFLIELNDDFIDKMVMFEEVVDISKKPEDYTDNEKEKINNIVIAENTILSRLDSTPPNKDNKDFEKIYENMKESFALYIQGQLMKVEYIYQTSESISDEKFVLGDSVTNLIGNFIIEYNELSNSIRNTDYKMKYTVLTGVKDIFGDADIEKIERDEDGKIIIDKDKEYIYIPENEELKTKENLNDIVEDFSNIKDNK